MQKADLEKSLGLEVDGLTQLAYVLMISIAQGGTTDSLAAGLKVDKSEIESIIAEINSVDQRFDRAIATLRVDATGGVIDRDFGWDDLERIVLRKLQRVVGSVKDPDVLTRIAIAANRAKRSTDAPTGGAKVQVGEGGTVILAGGDLGVMHLSLSHRVAKQLASPESAPKQILEGETTPPGTRRGIEMLRLADIRTIAEDIGPDSSGQESAGESVVADKQRIKVDSSLVDDILGREYS